MTGHALSFSFRRATAIGATALGLLAAQSAGAAPGDTDWIMDLMDERCSPDIKTTMAEATRETIEQHVARANAAIEPPAPVGDLGCLNDLMNQDLDIFSNVGGLLGSLSEGLNGSLPSTDGSMISGAICQFAADKWADVTGGITGSLDEIVSGVQIPNVGENFNMINISGRTNQARETTGSGSGSGSTTGGTSTTQGQAEDEPAPQAPVAVSPSGTNDTVQEIWDSMSGPAD